MYFRILEFKNKLVAHKRIVVTVTIVFVILTSGWLVVEWQAPQIDTDTIFNEDTRVFPIATVDVESANISIRGSHGFFSFPRRCYVKYLTPITAKRDGRIIITANLSISYTLSATLFSSASLKVSYILASCKKWELDIVDVYNHTVSGATESSSMSLKISASPSGGYCLLEGNQYYVGIRLTVVLAGQ